MLPPSGRSLPRIPGRENLRGRNEHEEQYSAPNYDLRVEGGLRTQNQQPQQAPAYNRTSRVAAWNEQRRQASANQARAANQAGVATTSSINSSPSGPPPRFSPTSPHLTQRGQFGLPYSRTEPGFDNNRLQVQYPTQHAPIRSPALRSESFFGNQGGLQAYHGEHVITESDVKSQQGGLDRHSPAFSDNFSSAEEADPQPDDDQPREEESWHLQEPLYRDHSGFPITRGMIEERSVRESRLRFSDNFSQVNIPCPGSADEEDQAENQPHLGQQYDGEARAEPQSDLNQLLNQESEEDYQSRLDREYIRDFQARFQARHDEQYRLELLAERQPPIEQQHDQEVKAPDRSRIDQQHGQEVEAQDGSRPARQDNSEFQTKVQGSHVQQYPREIQAENRSRLNQQHNSGFQTSHQARQASHARQYPRILRGQNQPRVRQPFNPCLQATRQARQAPHAQQYPRVLRGQNQPRVRQQYNLRIPPVYQVRHAHQQNRGYDNAYQAPHERKYCPEPEISLAEALRMDHPRSLTPYGHPSAASAYSASNYSNNPPSDTDVMDRRSDLREYPIAPRPSVGSFDRLSDMRHNGHGPGFYEGVEVAAHSNENNGADIRRADAGNGAAYGSPAGYSNPFDYSSPTGHSSPPGHSNPFDYSSPTGYSSPLGNSNPFNYSSPAGYSNPFDYSSPTRLNPPAGSNHSAGHNSSVGVSSSDGFNGNPLVTILTPAPETHTSNSNSRTSNSLPSPLMVGLGAHESASEGENGSKNEKKKTKEMKEKAKKAKAWLLKAARETYGSRVL